jgi:glutathione S-transferase
MSARRLSHVTDPLALTSDSSPPHSDSLVVHHLHVSQSERIPFLCEELGIPYTLRLWDRSPFLAPAEFKAMHPAGTAPIIQHGSLTLAESGACMDYISHRFAGGRLFLPATHAEYPDFIYWFHWANSTLQTTFFRVATLKSAGVDEDHPARQNVQGRLDRQLGMMDRRLGSKGVEWLAGEEFTAADIMVVFTLTTMRYFYPFSLGDYGNILAYLVRIGKREGYKRAMEKCDPDMELLLGADPPAKSLM